MNSVRLQKAMSEQGLCSRREAERHIVAGRVRVNGNVITELGTKINPDTDNIELDTSTTQHSYIAFNKPRGIMSNCPEPHQQEILDLLPTKFQDLSTIGRLDRDSEGIILLTNDGRFAKYYLDAEEPHERVYLVWLNAPLSPGQKQRLEEGVLLSGQETKPLQIEILDDAYISITMCEGKNRQIRRMVQKVDLDVLRLQRIRFDTYKLDDLEPGEYRNITPN